MRILQASAPVPTEEAVRDHLASEIVYIQNRLQQQEYSLQSIQGEVANLSNKVAQISISLGMHILDGTSQYQASCFGIHRDVQFNEVPIYDVNDEEIEGYSSENETPPPPPPMSATASDQMKFQAFERMPVFDVDEDDMDGCSTEFVDVLAGTSKQQTYEEEQQESKQPTKCFSEPIFSPEIPSVGSVSEHATDFTSTHVPYLLVDESLDCYKTNNKIKRHSIDSELGGTIGKARPCATRQWKILLTPTLPSLVFLFDPGASASLHSSKTEPCRERSYVVFPKVLTLCTQVGTYVQQLRESRWNVLIMHERRKEWDSGDTNLHVLFTTAAVATKLQCMDAYKSAIVQILDVQFGAIGAPILESAIMHSYMTLSKSVVPNLVQKSQTLFKLLIFIEPPVDLKHFWAQLL